MNPSDYMKELGLSSRLIVTKQSK